MKKDIDDLCILEYSETQGFHYNMMQYATGTRTFRPVTVAGQDRVSNFCATLPRSGMSYEEICRRWEAYWTEHRDEILREGWR